MPTNIIFDINKNHFKEIQKKSESISTDSSGSSESSLKLTLPIEIIFSSPEELGSLVKFIQEDKKLEYLKINLPGSFNFNELLTEELIKEQPPNLKITIQEKVEGVATTTFNEFL